MAEPLTVHVCAKCRRVFQHRPLNGETMHVRLGNAFAGCNGEMVETQLFSAEDVRPLWEAASRADPVYRSGALETALLAFPAPEEWTRDEEDREPTDAELACDVCRGLPADRALSPDEECTCDYEPTDDELYNRHGVEGGIAYETTPDMRDEHDPSL